MGIIVGPLNLIETLNLLDGSPSESWDIEVYYNTKITRLSLKTDSGIDLLFNINELPKNTLTEIFTRCKSNELIIKRSEIAVLAKHIEGFKYDSEQK